MKIIAGATSKSHKRPWNKALLNSSIPSVEDGFNAVREASRGLTDTKDSEQQRKIFEIMDSLPKSVAHKVYKKFKKESKAELKEIKAKQDVLFAEEKELSDKIKSWEDDILAHNNDETTYKVGFEILEFLKDGVVLQKAPCSKLHKLINCLKDGNNNAPSSSLPHIKILMSAKFNTFVVQHDWAKAFAKSENVHEGEVRLPYEDTCFEFKINDHHVCVLFNIEAGGTSASMFIEHSGSWMNIGQHGANGGFKELWGFVREQVRIICIMLDAEVAETEVVRAPHKLNSQREKSGRLPLYDYHILKLAHRTRVVPLPDDHIAEERRHPRLHFVRGHWKHYANHKTWTKWFMRGDPDLGFVDKEYRL